MARRTLAVAAASLLAATLFPPASAQAAPAVTNPGFEASGPTANPPGWNESGQTSASYTEPGGRSGSHRLAHWAQSGYQVETSQFLGNVPTGFYTLRVWVRSSGGQNAAYLALRSCGAGESRVDIPQTSTTTWQQLSVSANVTAGSCTIVFHSEANSGNWINFDDVSFTGGGGGTGSDLVKGVDVSTLAKNEAFGGTYFDAGGSQVDPLALLRDNGVDYARLKVWVDPPTATTTVPACCRWRSASRRSGWG